MGSWPIVARPEIARALQDALTAQPPRSQLLRGPSGTGKTTIAAEVAAGLAARGRTVVPIVALDELRDIPLGAFAPLLASSRFADVDDVAERMRGLLALVGRHAGSYLLVVDDAPLLDDASASSLYQLLRVFGVPALLTARDEHPLRGAVARLLHEGLVSLTELGGLSLEQTHEALRRRLDGAPSPDSLARVHRLTRGNPLFLRELTLAAERVDQLRPGPFGIEIVEARLPDHILATVAERLTELQPEQRVFAEMLAVAQPWSPAATRPEETAIAQDLVDAGVVSPVDGTGSGYLHLAHPVFAEALLAGLDARTRAARQRTAAQRLRALGDPSSHFLAVSLEEAAAAADGLAGPSTDDLVWASRTAHAMGEHEHALRFADRVLAVELRADAALQRASALSALGSFDEADVAFAAAAEAAGDEETIGLIHLRWGQHTAVRRHEPATAVARVSDVLATATPAVRALVQHDLAKWRLMAGDADALEGDVDPAATGPAALTAMIGSAMIATMAGRVTEGRLAVEAGRALADQYTHLVPFGGSLLDLSAFLALVGDGRIAEAREQVENHRMEPFTDSAGIWSYSLALIHAHAGRLHDAMPLAALAIDQLRWRDFTGLVGPAIALHATISAQTGAAGSALASLAEIAASLGADVKVLLQAAEAEAWIAAVEGEPGSVGEIIAPAVRRGVDLGHHVLAALSATVAIRLGAAAAVRDDLERAAAESDSALVTLVARLATAVGARDVTAILDLAPALERAGVIAVAHDALRDAAGWSGSPLARQALAQARGLERLIVAPGGATRNAVAGLTEREWEIAQAAARRERSREIAQRLGVSVRTVDNHLASVYRKLGVAGRPELERAIAN